MKKIFLKNELKTLLQWKKWQPLNRVPHGHFYSPIVSKSEIEDLEKLIWREKTELKEIDLNLHFQEEILTDFKNYYADFVEFTSSKNYRYKLNNQSFEHTDAFFLFSMIQHFQPKKIIEIGSGNSSALMLDVREKYDLQADLTFIDPFPQNLKRLIKKEDENNCKIIEQKVQKADLEIFKALKKNDFLFIDSSHVSKTGSDVNFELFQILPNLNSGVFIHFHDIFYPFEYPKNWVLSGRNWNENYILRAFLSYNNEFEIVLFSDFLHKFSVEKMNQFPITRQDFGGSLWLRKK